MYETCRQLKLPSSENLSTYDKRLAENFLDIMQMLELGNNSLVVVLI